VTPRAHGAASGGGGGSGAYAGGGHAQRAGREEGAASVRAHQRPCGTRPQRRGALHPGNVLEPSLEGRGGLLPAPESTEQWCTAAEVGMASRAREVGKWCRAAGFG
jgi:hypothetical protein